MDKLKPVHGQLDQFMSLYDNVSIHHTDPTSQAWQAYETSTGENSSKKIEFEEVVEKKRPFGRFRPDGTWDDEDDEAKARQTKLAFMRFVMVTSSVFAVYLLLHFYFFELSAHENDSKDAVQCRNIGDVDPDSIKNTYTRIAS